MAEARLAMTCHAAIAWDGSTRAPRFVIDDGDCEVTEAHERG